MKKVLMLIIFSVLLIPSIVLASSFSLKMSCPRNASAGERVSCKITANIDESVTEISSSFSVIGLENISFAKNSSLNFTKADNSGFKIQESSGIYSKTNTNSIEVGTISATIPSSATESSSYEIILNDINSNLGVYPNITSTIKIKSSDNKLKSLKVGNYDLIPAFDSNTLSYRVNAEDIPKITITAVANNSGATITGVGEVKLGYGNNTIKVVVRSETGENRTYKIIINRFDSRDKTNTLDNLVVVGYDLDKPFSPETNKYTVTVESSVKSVTIKSDLTLSPEKNKIMSKYVKGNGPRTIKNLNYGDNKVYVKVQAENEKVKTYTIIVHRIDDRDPNNYLKSLEISSGKYKFDKETTSYTINVENNVSVVSIKAIAESEKATVTSVSKLELNEGSNKTTIKVQAENEKVREYKITINRLKAGTTVEEVENITYLKQLKISGRNFVFNQKNTTYEIPITKERELTFIYELFDGAEGTIEIKDDPTGPIKLSNKKSEITMSPIIDGSVIYLNLTSEEGYSRQFTFNIKTADYYIGDIDIPVEKEKLVIKWTWQLIVALVSVFIILCEIAFAVYYAIKNGGVENKRAETEASIKKGIDYTKGFSERSEKRREERERVAKIKKEEKLRQAELKKKEAEERKRQKEQDKINAIENKKIEKEVKELEKKMMEEKIRFAQEAQKQGSEYAKELEKTQGK